MLRIGGLLCTERNRTSTKGHSKRKCKALQHTKAPGRERERTLWGRGRGGAGGLAVPGLGWAEQKMDNWQKKMTNQTLLLKRKSIRQQKKKSRQNHFSPVRPCFVKKIRALHQKFSARPSKKASFVGLAASAGGGMKWLGWDKIAAGHWEPPKSTKVMWPA